MHLRKRCHLPRRPTHDREAEDLYQEGVLGLIEAAKRYDPAKDGLFAPFALQRIRRAIFKAICERFSLVPIPANAKCRTGYTVVDAPIGSRQSLASAADDHRLEAPDQPDCDETGPTIRHYLRSRFERAVRLALEEIRQRTWRPRNPWRIMARIAAERLLISREDHRISLRDLADESRTSNGRVGDYQRILLETIQRHLARDPQLPLLLRFARESNTGFDGIVSAERRERLRQAELRAFKQRLARIERPHKAELLLRLIERSGINADEVAVNLYRMTERDATPLPIPA